nr:acyl-CoA dehydrogenase family protein [Sphingomonas jinjuensis]
MLTGLTDDDAFRRGVQAWLANALPTDWRTRLQGATEEDVNRFQLWWLEERRKVGLATPHWPREWGGPGLPFSRQIIAYEEMARADAPELELMLISLFHLPATLFDAGTQEQRDLYLSGVRDGNDVWCQGFSEPGAGSDLASIRTTAARDADHYVVNGQKTWSSYAMYADYCLLLVRTDPHAARKHDGLSLFILDMRSPGVTVRPIRQITGEGEFAEIFLDDVIIPASNRIGAENRGWAIAQSTLSSERGLLLLSYAERVWQGYRKLSQVTRPSWLSDVGLRREFASFHAELLTVRLMIGRLLSMTEESEEGRLATLPVYIKLYWAPLLQRYTEFLVRAGGLVDQEWQPPVACTGHSSGVPALDFLKSFSWTISGGSNEIMRNIVAERFLGLPRA